MDLNTIPISPIRRVGDLLFVSGQLPFDKAGKLARGDIKEQTLLVIENIRSALRSEGADLGDVVKVTCWLSDSVHMIGYNEAYAAAFSRPFPARSTVVAQLLVPADIEMEVIAAAPSKTMAE